MNQFYQVFSRNNDVNGNPYRLIVLYSVESRFQRPTVIEAVEARSSSPNYVYRLYTRGIPEIQTVHCTPSYYNRLKRHFNAITPLQHVD